MCHMAVKVCVLTAAALDDGRLAALIHAEALFLCKPLYLIVCAIDNLAAAPVGQKLDSNAAAGMG